MFNSSLIEMTKGRWREFCREPSALFFVVLMPIVWMLILGVSFSENKEESFEIGIVSQQYNPPIKIIDMLKELSHVKIHQGDNEAMSQLLKRGEINLWVNFSRDDLTYHYDRNNPTSIRTRDFINNQIQVFLGRKDPILVKDSYIQIKGNRYIDFLIPGLLALSILTTSLYGTGMTLVANRREKLLKLYRVSPMKIYSFFLSHVLGRFLILFVEMLSVMISGKIFFDFEMTGHWLNYILVAVLGAASFTALSIACGSRLTNASTYNGMTNLIMLPMMLLSGIWFSRNSFPDWLYHITEFLPLTALVNALRKIALEGADLSQVLHECLLLVAILVTAAMISKKTFKWY